MIEIGGVNGSGEDQVPSFREFAANDLLGNVAVDGGGEEITSVVGISSGSTQTVVGITTSAGGGVVGYFS